MYVFVLSCLFETLFFEAIHIIPSFLPSCLPSVKGESRPGHTFHPREFLPACDADADTSFLKRPGSLSIRSRRLPTQRPALATYHLPPTTYHLPPTTYLALALE
jgi:hypothetical protein